MANNKKRYGKYPNDKIQSSNFIPKVFNTETNQSWLDSTLDQMISKGELDIYEGFIGGRHGNYANKDDVYVNIKNPSVAKQSSQLKPAITLNDNDENITHTVAFDDVVNGIRENFDTYNYNAAYSSQPFVFSPPVNIDMLINYQNYYWVQNLPIYTSTNSGAFKDIIKQITNESVYKLEDDNNTFFVENGMFIKFDGTWGQASGNTYIVTGVGTSIKLILFQDFEGKFHWTNQYYNNIKSDGYWDRNKVYTVIHRPSIRNYTGNSLAMLSAYSLDTHPDKPVFFDGFDLVRHDSNNDKLVQNSYVRFPDLDGIYYLEVESGKVTATVLTDPLSEGLGDSYDSDNWDYEPIIPTEPDYIVIARNDTRQSAFSRSNAWMHINAIRTICGLVTGAEIKDFATQQNKAKRSIIEFEAGMNLWNHADLDPNIDMQWVGNIDYLIAPVNEFAPISETGIQLQLNPGHGIPVGSIVAYTTTYTSHLYKMKQGDILEEIKELVIGNTSFVENVPSADFKQFENIDIKWNGSNWSLVQLKTSINQEPLFKVYDTKGIGIETYDSTFKGSPLFGYEIGSSGTPDEVLGKILSYKDTPNGAEYQFFNYLDHDNFSQRVSDSVDAKLSWKQDINGFCYFKQDDELTNLYKTSDVIFGAPETLQYTITDENNDLVIPIGYDNYRQEHEFTVHVINDQVNITRTDNQGTTSTKNINQYKKGILVDNNTVVKFHNLTTEDLKFSDDGVDIEDILYTGNATVTRTSTTTMLDVGSMVTGLDSNKINVHFTDTTTTPLFKVTVIESINNQFSQLTINGNLIDYNFVTVGPSQTTISQLALKEGDIVDIEFFNNDNNNDSSNANIPTLWTSNSTNKTFDSFSISELSAHFEDIMFNIPGFDGTAFGENNFSQITRLTSYGGKIFLHNDSGVMHDVQYADKTLNLTGALYEQGKDYDSFMTRFRNQVRRLYNTKVYSNVHEILVDALDVLLTNKKGGQLYSASNMAYSTGEQIQKELIDSTQTTIQLKNIPNGDTNIRDHVYVWLTDNMNSDDILVRRMLTKDVDYVIEGKTLTILTTPIALSNGAKNTIEIEFHNMDTPCYIPQSVVKLGLKFGTQPQVVNNRLLTHDGNYYDLAPGAELYKLDSMTFDPVNAAQLELELMIYSGLVKSDKLYTQEKYATVDKFMPSQHRGAWFTLEHLDNYVYPYFSKWARRKDINPILEESMYDANDSTTWNYKDMSSTILSNYPDYMQNVQLPGHYVGIYTVLFGTHQPHINPWHMLGFSFKPTWWDTYYSWTDSTKRNALIDAVQRGIVSKPGDKLVQDPSFARYGWDWTTKCPVNTSGDLMPISEILGNIAGTAEAATPFVFGDYGPTEQKYRFSAEGYAVTVDAMLKLLPAKAFTYFFQPGVIDYKTVSPYNVDTLIEKTISPSTFIQPGFKDNKVLTKINVESQVTGFVVTDDDTNIYGSEIGIVSKPVVTFDANGFVTAIALNKRLYNVKDEAILRSDVLKNIVIGGQLEENIELEYVYDNVEYVANGISQALYNYTHRNNYTVDLETTYNKLTTNLLQKANGFTNKSSINFFAESSFIGSYGISSQDYKIVMHKGYPHTVINASQIIIKRDAQGYQVYGISNNRQDFRFFEPETSGTRPFREITVSNKTLKKYFNFAKETSVAEYGTTFSKIQDVYNFVRGYFAYLETLGFNHGTNKEAQANLFINWTVRAVEGDELILDLGSKVEITATHGHVVEFDTLRYPANNMLYKDGTVVDIEDVQVKRKNESTVISTKQGATIGNITIAILDYEHAFVFNDRTTFGQVIQDSAKATTQQRLLARGGITKEWDGNKRAPGYLVFDDHIVQNFDSSVQEINDYYKTDVTEFNKNIRHAKDITIGNIEREWLNDLYLDPNVVTKFYQGAIKESGTNASIDRLARFIKGAKDITISEKFMFNHSYFGDTTRKSSTEIQLKQSELTNNPQVVEFAENKTATSSIAINTQDARFVNKSNTQFNVGEFNSTDFSLKTAGEMLSTEADYYAFNTRTLPSVYDSTANYATIESWNNSTSYVIGDLVRYQSRLYKCIVDSTGLTVTSEGITETGTKTNPTFPFGTVVDIGSQQITLQDTTIGLNDIVAVGSIQNPIVRDSNRLTLNGTTVEFRGTTQQQTVVAPATIIGNIPGPVLPSVAGQSITINGTPINFDTRPSAITDGNLAIASNTPPNIPEVFIVPIPDPITDPVQDTFTISTPLSGTTYSVFQVAVDGILTTNFTVSGQDLTVNETLTGGETIDVLLRHVQTLQDTYTITDATLSPLGYFLSQVRVAGNVVPSSNYVVNGQDVTFNDTSSFAPGNLIQFDLEYIDQGMNTADILQAINNAGITGLTAGLSAQGTIQLDLTSTSLTATLTVASAATNSLLFLFDINNPTVGDTENVVTGFAFLPLTMQEILDQFNQASFPNTTATEQNNALVITVASADENLVVTDGNGLFGLDALYPYSTTTVNTYTNMIRAVEQINNHMTTQGITDITASVQNSRINISSTRSSLDFGNTTFNNLAGLPTGIQSTLIAGVQNSFEYYGVGDARNDWEELSDDQDPVLFNIWIVNDTDYEVAETDTIKTKYNDWNVLQVQNHGLYTFDSNDPDGCGICAGAATSDGNDAQVTTISDHNLQVGDFVLLTNTTTQPNIDGIHKVTQVHPSDNKIFYIDKFIDRCGNASSVMVLRSQRFETNTQLNAAEASTLFQIPNLSLSFVKFDDNEARSTNVFRKTAASGFVPERKTIQRILNNDVENITIYDYNNNTVVKQLELFDPLRGIIPGIAQSEIDMTSDVDLAAYNQTSNEEYTVVEDNYWSQDQVGKRWWDTSTTRYYDYDQGDLDYKSTHWGRLFPGSSIDVYEWTKSSVPPEEYAQAVEGKVEMFGTVSSGEAFYIYNDLLQENEYFYSSVEEWDALLGNYNTCYYFWVKNKNTYPANKMLTNKAVADIISNPTANGIAWFSVIESNAFITANTDLYLNDTSSVLQINIVPDGINHNSWTSIARGSDLIPDYYYIGLRNNLATVDAKEQTLPDYYVHPFNRYGDDRNIRQAWFQNHGLARQNARDVINALLKDINLYRNYRHQWNREFIKNNMPDKTWKWVDYVSKYRSLYAQPTLTITNSSELSGVDTSVHTIVLLKTIQDDLVRDEIWEYQDNDWYITEKKNSTIELDQIVARKRAGWDVFAWDSTIWDDTSTKVWWRIIVDACRNDWFTDINKFKFNEFFFAMVDSVFSEQDQPNWVHKTTYVKLDIVHDINTTVRKYTRSTVNNIIGYVNTVKPFHTKIDNIVDTSEALEHTNISIVESPKQVITMKLDDLTRTYVGTIYDGGDDWNTTYDQEVDSGNMWDSSASTTYNNGPFLQPEMYASINNPLRQHNLHVDIDSSIGIVVQTNTNGSTVDANTRTFTYLRNYNEELPMFVGLEDAKTSTTTTAIDLTTDEITVTDATNFSNNGFLYINSEIMEYYKDGNILHIIDRATNNTRKINAPLGTSITDITDSLLTASQVSGNTLKLNDMGKSILTSSDSLTASELNALGKGIAI